MSRLSKLGIASTCLLGVAGLQQNLAAQEAHKPNIVFILADDLGWMDLSVMGSDYYETPNIDRLASQGILFDNAYAAAANSAPSRACIMSGLYTPRHGIYTVSPSERGDKTKRKLIPIANTDDLRTEFVTIAEMLQQQSYQCGHIGKWHLGDDVENTGPISQGFIYNVGGRREGTPYSYFYPYCNNDNKCLFNLEDGEEGEYLTQRLTNEAISFIKNNAQKPFFLHLAHHAVHTPLQAPESLVGKYENKQKGKYHSNATYAAMLEELDNSVGKICQTIEELGIAQNTIIVFYSDNGGSMPVTNNFPLNGGKGTPYEGGIRVPLIIKWDGVIEKGVRSSIPLTGVDFFPTFVTISNAPKQQNLDGENIFDLLASKQMERNLYWHFPAYLESYGDGGIGFRAKPYSSIRKGDWKLIINHEDNSTELYNLAEDISETINLSDKKPLKAQQLLEDLKKWIEETQAPIPTQINPNYVKK